MTTNNNSKTRCAWVTDDPLYIHYNDERAHSSLEYDVPAANVDEPSAKVISMNQYRWKLYARNLFQLPITG